MASFLQNDSEEQNDIHENILDGDVKTKEESLAEHEQNKREDQLYFQMKRQQERQKIELDMAVMIELKMKQLLQEEEERWKLRMEEDEKIRLRQ